MSIEILRNGEFRQAETGVIFSTKDRCDFSQRTAPPALSEPGCDGYWLDGSDTEEGRKLPIVLADRLPSLREVHLGVRGGPDRAIIWGLSYLLDRGYKYVVLVENDVLLDSGWLAVLLDALERGTADGLRVGAVTARTYEQRVLMPRAHYAVMWNIGAGMLLLAREAAEAVLACYRTTTTEEVARAASWATGVDVSSKLGLPTAPSLEKCWTSVDWFFDAALMQQGWASLGTLPARARNIDSDYPIIFSAETQAGVAPRQFDRYVDGIWKPRRTRDQIAVHYSPSTRLYTVFPHQLSPSMRIGTWERRWRQVFGPFEFSSRTKGDGFSFELFEGNCNLIFQAGPDRGPCEVSFGETRKSIDLDAPDHRTAIVGLSKAGFGPKTISLTVGERGATWHALQFSDWQPWFGQLCEWRTNLGPLGLLGDGKAR